MDCTKIKGLFIVCHSSLKWLARSLPNTKIYYFALFTDMNIIIGELPKLGYLSIREETNVDHTPNIDVHKVIPVAISYSILYKILSNSYT